MKYLPSVRKITRPTSFRNIRHSSHRSIRNNNIMAAASFLPMNASLAECGKPVQKPLFYSDPQIRESVDKLEELKRKRVEAEDYDMADKIKESLGNLYGLLVSVEDCEMKMRDAVAAEDFELAARLKRERDEKKKDAERELAKVEGRFMGRSSANADDSGDGCCIL